MKSRFLAFVGVALLTTVAAGCSLTQSNSATPPAAAGGANPNDSNAIAQLGFPITATKDTTRVAGSDPVADAAGVASAVFPSTAPQTRPATVVLIDKSDWQGGVAASALAAPPASAAVLLSDGGALPQVTSQTLQRLKPKGTGLPSHTQVVRIGSAPAPGGFSSTVIAGGDPYALAAAVDHFQAIAKGRPSGDVIVASGEQAAYAMPAAAWAARSGDAVLFTRQNSIPAPTLSALREHQRPNIYLLGPPSAISTTVEHQLGALGKVKRIQGPDPVQTAIAFARYKDGAFGFGQIVPGQNWALASTARPLDAAAAAPLASNGIFGSLLLTNRSDQLPTALQNYFLDVEPGYQNGDPSQGVFNHVWILGASDVVSAIAQDQIDSDTELAPVDQTSTP